mmetsp:Transcript_15000/g.32474  ORF Transcript_15000/g.32474 Transcript_15000/m.32474 type:complete len:358 (+) Transcript_15000:3542-4615(+)
MLLFVVLECFQQEGSSLLHPVAGEKGLGGSLNINQWSSLGTDQTLSQIQSTLRVVEQELTEHGRIVHRVSHRRRVGNNLVVLPTLHEALDSLGMTLAPQIHTQSHCSIVRHDQITQRLGAMKLIILQPLLHQLRPSLLQHRLGQLNTLLLIQLDILQQGREVLKHGLRSTRLCRNLLESRNRLRSPQCRATIGHKNSRFLHLPGRDETFKLGSVQVLSSRKTQSSSHLNGQIIVPQRIDNVRNQILPIQANTKHLSRTNGNSKHCPSRRLRTSDKYSLLRYPCAKHGLSTLNIKHVDEPHLGKKERDIIFRIHHKRHWEIRSCLRRHGNHSGGNTKRLSLGRIPSHLHHEQLMCRII